MTMGMELEITESGFGQVEIFNELTPDMQRFHLEGTTPMVLKGQGFKALMQEFRGERFSAWYSRYWIKSPTVLNARGNIPFLELRIGWRNIIRGSMESIDEPELKMHYFTISFDTHVNTTAIFEAAAQYETFDIHIDVRMLYEFGVDYKVLQEFIDKVLTGRAGNIGDTTYSCPKIMIDAVFAILTSPYSGKEKKLFMECKIKEILISALVSIGTPEKILPSVLNSKDKEKLDEARQFIALSVPSYPGNKKICRRTGLNETKLSVGFKHFFGQSPYDYFLHQKMLMAKEMLLSTDDTMEVISAKLDYRWATAFAREFKKHFGYTPSDFARNHGRPRKR
ncbi:helix-turn-helix domain-containing protein [Arachidicoccus terrestris]|uniref:helix-turn-helix domain-containing protein n=1 Tax=Arachidicoccus terrestris TaxID=2875539 RepID=UPI001CC6349B|nr:AraC family transcriptional regulator [Arachidicoccus terrestris]UAY55758.1 AraC family transcriptional regulator [Arachidicoccus terrestris]